MHYKNKCALRLLAVILFAFCSSLKLNAQAFDSAKFVATIQPQFIAVHGWRGDVDLRLFKNPYKWINIGMQAHQGLSNLDRSASTRIIQFTQKNIGDELWGLGVDVYYKTFLPDKNYKSRQRRYKNKKQPLITTSPFYIAYGLGYRYYNINFQDAGWVEQEEGGIKYIVYENPKGIMEIHAPSAGIQFGKRIFFRNDVTVMDIYAGVGYRQSYSKSKPEKFRSYTRGFWDFEYAGLYPMAGLKMGFLFK